jgi:HSP20 family protein
MFNLIPWGKSREGTPARRPEDNPVARLRDEFELILDRFVAHWPTPFESSLGRGSFWGFDVDDRGNEVVVTAEAPGFEADDFDVQISGNMLTITTERRHETKGKRGNGHQEERHYATFRRVANLPPGILADKVEAKYHNGVLELHVPKSEVAKAKRIPIKS